jgi:hypothetical protein
MTEWKLNYVHARVCLLIWRFIEMMGAVKHGNNSESIKNNSQFIIWNSCGLKLPESNVKKQHKYLLVDRTISVVHHKATFQQLVSF